MRNQAAIAHTPTIVLHPCRQDLEETTSTYTTCGRLLNSKPVYTLESAGQQIHPMASVQALPLGGQLAGQATDDMATVAETGLSEYEIRRNQLIARNRAKMMALGLQSATDNLAPIVVRPKAHPVRHVHKPPTEPEEPTRKSARLQHQAAVAAGEVVEEEEVEQEEEGEQSAELTQFIIEGKCPRCGKRMGRGHRQHLERCEGPPEVQPLVLTEEELRAQAEELKRKENERLAALELEGLIDFTDDRALFLVIGSHGDPYKVGLSDAKRTCQCMDHRFRHRDCKHIRLILVGLGCMDKPHMWRQAVDAKFLSHGGEQPSATGEAAEHALKHEEQPVAGKDGAAGGKRKRGKSSAKQSAARASKPMKSMVKAEADGEKTGGLVQGEQEEQAKGMPSDILPGKPGESELGGKDKPAHVQKLGKRVIPSTLTTRASSRAVKQQSEEGDARAKGPAARQPAKKAKASQQGEAFGQGVGEGQRLE